MYGTLSSICSISMDSESKTCSLSNGAVSADVLGIVDVPILLYATSFISISFSNLRACFRKTTNQINGKQQFNEPLNKVNCTQSHQTILTVPF